MARQQRRDMLPQRIQDKILYHARRQLTLCGDGGMLSWEPGASRGRVRSPSANPVTKRYGLAGKGRGTDRGTEAMSTVCYQGVGSAEAGYLCRQSARCGGPCLW